MAAVLLLCSSAAMAQTKPSSANLPVGYDRASGQQPTGAPADAVVLPEASLFTPGANLMEGFNDVTTLPAAGWALINRSEPLGTGSWFQGNPVVFPAQAGAPNAYIGTNFQATTGAGTISNWLLTPQLAIANGSVIRFFTRTTTPGATVFPDRLEVRMSTAGASTNVGTTSASVGDFTTLLLSVNPDLTTTGYPSVFTEFTATVAGLPAATSGRFAFRYFVTDGGPNGANSDYIGIDEVSVTGQVTGPVLAVTPTTINFNNVVVGTTATPQTVTLTNSGTTPVVVSSITFTGTNGLTASPTAPVTIAPGGTSTVTITFTPTAAGAATGTLTITSNGTATPVTVTVTGTAASGNTVVQSFCSGTPIDIPESGPATPYPAVATATGILAGQSVTDVNVRLVGLSHTFPADLDIFVAGPSGASSFIMSDAGGGFDVTAVDLTFDDQAAAALTTAQIVSGMFRPTNLGTGTDPFPAPAPTPAGTSLAALNSTGTAGNGAYSLYVVDDLGGDFGTLTDFCVDLTVDLGVAGENGPGAGEASLTASPNPVRTAGRVRLAVETAQDVTVAVYDVTGRQVATLFQGAVAAGQSLEMGLDASSLPSGVYVVRAMGDSVNLTERVTVVR